MSRSTHASALARRTARLRAAVTRALHPALVLPNGGGATSTPLADTPSTAAAHPTLSDRLELHQTLEGHGGARTARPANPAPPHPTRQAPTLVGCVNTVEWSPDSAGELLVSGSDDRCIALWPLATGFQAHTPLPLSPCARGAPH